MSDDDDRVRCRMCRHYTGTVRGYLVRLVDGKEERDWYEMKTCKFGLGCNPDILRRCDRFEVAV